MLVCVNITWHLCKRDELAAKINGLKVGQWEP